MEPGTSSQTGGNHLINANDNEIEVNCCHCFPIKKKKNKENKEKG